MGIRRDRSRARNVRTRGSPANARVTTDFRPRLAPRGHMFHTRVALSDRLFDRANDCQFYQQRDSVVVSYSAHFFLRIKIKN